MNPTLPAEAAEFGATAERALAGIGAVDAARRAEADPDVRRGPVASTLEALGIDGLDPRADLDTAAAGGELCRAAGRVALPYPVVAVLLRHPSDGLPFALVPEDRCRVDHGDLFNRWRVETLAGAAWEASPVGARLGSRLGPFVTDLSGPPPAGPPPAGPPSVDVAPASAPADVVLHLTLTAWLVLGVVERAIELAVAHVSGRVQFGQPLSAFQAVQFQLADAAVGADGLRELCRFTLWRLFASSEGALADALALRVHALDVARAVLRTTQQLHGAAGVCDEYDISVLVRHVQPALRLPFGAERATAELVNAVARLGFASLFPHGAALDGAVRDGP